MLVGVVVAAAAPDCEAQLFGSKKPKGPPQQRVPELIFTVKQDKDSHKRSDAAEELRQYDPTQFPEIIPVLIDVLHSDSSASVRIEAATSLGRLRPISVAAGQALDKATSDPNLLVRLQARTSLTYYQLSGYHGAKTKDPTALKGGSTEEPPLAAGQSDQWWNHGQTTSKKSTVTVTPGGSSTGYRPLPSGPSNTPQQVPVINMPPQQRPAPGPTIETNPPPLETPTPNASTWVPTKEQGPTLTPP
jgi:hypothetical protein